MGLLASIRSVLAAASETKPRDARTDQPVGSYWCDDCPERIPAADAEGPDPPSCPSCGETMTLERSPGTAGCAC